MSRWIQNLAYDLQYADYADFSVLDRTGLDRRRKEITVIIIATLLVLAGGLFFSCGMRRSNGFSWYKIAQFEGVAEVSPEVLQYEDLIEKYAAQYGITEYVPIIEAMMEQESGGRGTDVMQCSECYYNTEYEQVPGGIEDAEYSIATGIHYFADCLTLAECRSIQDTDRIRLALQGYNYGSSYIEWAQIHNGGYTRENAKAFSDQMRYEMGWTTYGDTEYPDHVLQYYH